MNCLKNNRFYIKWYVNIFFINKRFISNNNVLCYKYYKDIHKEYKINDKIEKRNNKHISIYYKNSYDFNNETYPLKKEQQKINSSNEQHKKDNITYNNLDEDNEIFINIS